MKMCIISSPPGTEEKTFVLYSAAELPPSQHTALVSRATSLPGLRPMRHAH